MALGNASSIWKITENEQQAETLPWSMRYVKCKDEESRSLCDDPTNKYRTLCSPEEFMVPKDPLGFREHRLKARVLAMALLEALEDALATWSTTTIMGMYCIIICTRPSTTNVLPYNWFVSSIHAYISSYIVSTTKEVIHFEMITGISEIIMKTSYPRLNHYMIHRLGHVIKSTSTFQKEFVLYL